MLVGEALADFFQILDVFFALIVPIGPVKGMEVTVLKIEGGLHKDAPLHIDPLALIFCGGEEELPECHVAGV